MLFYTERAPLRCFMRQCAEMRGAKQLLFVSAGVEGVTGVVAIVDPSLVCWLLFAVPLTIGGELVGRLAGCALISLAFACWPTADGRDRAAPIRALFVYNTLAAALFLLVGIGSRLGGILLWPAAVFHGVLAVLFIIAWRTRSSIGSVGIG